MSTKHSHIIDATRAADGAFVTLKRLYVLGHPDEINIGKFFQSPEQRADSANHCVPFLDALKVPSDNNQAIIVMPMLRRFDDPRFETIGEAMDFFDQIIRVCSGRI